MPETSTFSRATAQALGEIWEGLSRPQKELSPKYFYDRRGSELFGAITRLPEYYQTRTERDLIVAWAPSLVRGLGIRTMVELGAGSAEKTHVLLEAMADQGEGTVYVPVDVSAAFLQDTAERIRRALPSIEVQPAVADFAAGIPISSDVPLPKLTVFLGGTIGNFRWTDAVRLLGNVGKTMDDGDRLLMGIDLRKDRAIIEAAYNDSQGVTAEFNLNMLRSLNRRYHTTFDVESFGHRAFYNPDEHRIEMHLVALRKQEVAIPGHGVIHFDRGETVRTEVSCKYDRASVTRMFDEAGLVLEEMRTDPDKLFALVLGAPGR